MRMEEIPALLMMLIVITLIVMTHSCSNDVDASTKPNQQAQLIQPKHTIETADQTIFEMTPAIEVEEPIIKQTSHVKPQIKKIKYTSQNYRQDVIVLTEVLFHEARDDNYEKVFAVIINRLHHSLFPSTIVDVVYQPKQFSYIDDVSAAERKRRELKESKKYNEIRSWVNKTLASGQYVDMTDSSLYYYAHKKMDPPNWWEDRYHTVSTDKHSFASWHKVKRS